MKYNRFTFNVMVWNPNDHSEESIKVIVELTGSGTEAMRMVVEDWQEQRDGEIRCIAVEGITGFDRPEES